MGKTNSLSEGDYSEEALEMEDNEEIHKEDVKGEDDLQSMDIEENEQGEVVHSEGEGEECSKVVVKASHEMKLRELLRNIHSAEVQIYSEASKEFIRLLRGNAGGEMLQEYVQASPLCSELMEAWKLRQGKPGMLYVLSLISVILDHPDGRYKPDDLTRITISRRLDKVARSIIETKLEDVYKELNSKETKCQTAAFSLMAAVVRRGIGLAAEIAKIFDFKHPVFAKLAEYQKKKVGKKVKYSTRRSFIEFAMSFLEVGNPRLLRWILQQREMYSSVLRGLGSDEEDIVVYVLSTLQNRVLTPESLVPPGLRSVLFGNVTLDQLVSISGSPSGGHAAEMAHEVLVMVCTDTCNGLMPDFSTQNNPLKGNPKRLLALMRKLKATEIGYHRDLLLAIVNGRPFLAAPYMDEFPYVLEPRSSATWFSSISLLADLVASACSNLPSGFLALLLHDPPSHDDLELQSILKCIIPPAFSRMVINRGLLHSDVLVKHGSLKFLLEALKSLDKLFSDIDRMSCSSNPTMQKLLSFKQELQDEARALLPDPQVLLKLLSSLSYIQSRSSEVTLKTACESADLPEAHRTSSVKESKSNFVNNDADIFVSGISCEHVTAAPGDSAKVMGKFVPNEFENEKDHLKFISKVWGVGGCSMLEHELKELDIFFYLKLLDAIRFYLRTVPISLEGSFDFFKLLPGNPLALSVSLQRSLFALLIEYIGWSPRSHAPTRSTGLMYKHLQAFINLLVFSQDCDIRDQAYILARAAMLSTGAFDINVWEIDAWFLFLPGFSRCGSSMEGIEVLRDSSAAVVSFLSDAVSTLGNNLYKYLDLLRCCISNIKGFNDTCPDFSPLVICVLHKCLRLLDSGSQTFKLSEKTAISLYMCNTLSFLLQTQVKEGMLSMVIDSLVNKKVEDRFLVDDNSGNFLSEWKPLRNLLLFAQCISYQQFSSRTCSIDTKITVASSSFVWALTEVKRIIRKVRGGGLVGVAKAFCSSLICTAPDDIMENFPSVMTLSQHLFGAPFPLLSSIFFLDGGLFVSVAKLWPDLFSSGLEIVGAMIHGDFKKDDACLWTSHIASSSSAEQLSCGIDFDSIDNYSIAFGLLLKQTPFSVLFSAIASSAESYLWDSTKILDLLLAKLLEGPIDNFVISLRLILFWVHQIRSSYRIKPLDGLEKLYEICFIFIDHILKQLFVEKPGFDRSSNVQPPFLAQCIQEVVETIFSHPAVIMSLSNPYYCNLDIITGSLLNNFEDFLLLSKQSAHKMDKLILNLLTTVADYLAQLNDKKISSSLHDNVDKQLLKAFDALIQQLVLIFRDKFDMYIRTNDLMLLAPTLCVFNNFMHFLHPFELLELVDWIFYKVDANGSAYWESSKFSAVFVGFCIAKGVFEMLSSYQNSTERRVVSSTLIWKVEARSFDTTLLKKVYHKLIEFAIRFKYNFVDICLLKAVTVVYSLKYMQPETSLLPLCMVMTRVIISSPVEIIPHCIHGTSPIGAKLLFLLAEVSPLHLSLFGQMFVGILSKKLPLKGDVMEEDSDHAFSDEKFVMLLPVALLYLQSNLRKLGKQYYRHFRIISSFYSRIILGGFLNWKSYASINIFQEDFGESFPSSTEELVHLVGDSLLGKAIRMMQYHFAFNGDSMKMDKRLKLFDSIFPRSDACDELLDCDAGEINLLSLKQSLNIINRVVAKVAFSKMLLFPKGNQIHSLPTEKGDLEDIPLLMGSKEEKLSRFRFLNILVSCWQKIVSKVPSMFEDSKHLKTKESLQLFKYLEAFILRTILELSMEMQDDLVQMDFLPMVEILARSTLLYRFEDPNTLKALRGFLTMISEGKFPFKLVYELLLAHSKFVPTILWSDSVSISSGPFQSVALLRPISSILKSLSIPYSDQSSMDDKNTMDTSYLYKKKLEVIKLLRILYHLKGCCKNVDSVKDVDMNSRELLSLLLSCYGATLSEIDLEIFDLMHEIELSEGSVCGSIAEMDYLWGSSALKVRKEQALEKSLSSNNIADSKAAQEFRKRYFRDNIPIDPELCLMTVLNFPYGRTLHRAPTSPVKLYHYNFTDVLERRSASDRQMQCYDPAFIMHFSIHSLSMGYFEPMEFVGLGLLALAFVSICSLDEGIRKLGYEALGIFKNSLESCRNRKDGLRLQLLLTCLQNGIEEPWQKIPSIIGIFAAEASFILLDPSHVLYPTVTKFLMQSPRMNLKCIPLFHTLFRSSSVSFKADRLWMLHLSYAGLNLDDDAQLFMRNSIFEILMSFYASSLSDCQTKILIVQIVKKSVKLRKLARHLVEHCNLVSWLSFILSFWSEQLHGDQEGFFLKQLLIILEVVTDVISLRDISDWLQKYALEQLSELSSHLQKILVGGQEVINQNFQLLNSILQILVSALRISQKRNIYQPHFSLSVEGLLQLYQAIDGASSNMKSGLNADLGLKAILMSPPAPGLPYVDEEKLWKFVMWATSTAVQSSSTETSLSTNLFLLKESHPHFRNLEEEEQYDESLLSKLLRWLTASVILGRISIKSGKLNLRFSSERSKVETLQALFEHIKEGNCEARRSHYSTNEALASAILYLQQLLGMNCRVLPSVISALYLLLSDASKCVGTELLVGKCGIHMTSLCSKIRCPPEANPAWRWSFYQPWKDLSTELTDIQKMEEDHACQALLVEFSNALGGESSNFPVLSCQDLENTGVFEWEKGILSGKHWSILKPCDDHGKSDGCNFSCKSTL